MRPLVVFIALCLGCTGSLHPDVADWSEAFEAGESMGGASLEEVAQRASSMPPDLRLPYWDGVSHGLPVIDDLDAFAVAVEALHDREVRGVLWRGAVRAYTQEHASDPDLVLRYAREIQARDTLEPHEVADGIRIGLQRAEGYDLRTAIELGMRYPEELQGPIFEELGWRLGDEVEPRVANLAPALERYLPGVPESSRCFFVHGAVRGFTMRGIDRQLDELVDAVPDACRVAAVSGVGRAAFELEPGSPARRQVLLERWLSDPEHLERADAAAQAMGRVPTPGAPGLFVWEWPGIERHPG